MRFLRKIAICVLIIMSVCLLGGCEKNGNEGKLKKAATSYIKEKYGFKPAIREVRTTKGNWLAGARDSEKTGEVIMEYQGRVFCTYVELKAGDDICKDNYKAQDFREEIANKVSEIIKAEQIYVYVDYGMTCSEKFEVGENVTTLEELFANENNVTIGVSTYKIDKSSIDALKPASFGSKAQIGIFDWTDPKAVEASYVPPFVYEPDQGSMPYLAMHYYLDNEQKRVKEYDRSTIGDLTFVYEKSSGIQVAEEKAPVSSDDRMAVSEWIRVSSDSKEPKDIFVLKTVVGTETYTMEIYSEKDGKVQSFPMGISNTINQDSWCEVYTFQQRSVSAEHPVVFRIVRDFQSVDDPALISPSDEVTDENASEEGQSEESATAEEAQSTGSDSAKENLSEENGSEKEGQN